MLKCKICGTEFPAIRERHYLSRDLTKTGIAAAFGSTDEPALYDTFDCPNCGCQNVAQSRKREYDEGEELTDEEILEEIEPEVIGEYLGLSPRQMHKILYARDNGRRVSVVVEGGSRP